jgi:hypothetical protein
VVSFSSIRLLKAYFPLSLPTSPPDAAAERGTMPSPTAPGAGMVGYRSAGALPGVSLHRTIHGIIKALGEYSLKLVVFLANPMICVKDNQKMANGR